MRKLIIVSAIILLTGVAFGQTLQKGSMISIHVLTITLDPDATMNQYLDVFKNKSLPAMEKNMEGVKTFLLKGDRGENENRFAMAIYFESIKVRDRYWPSGGASEEMTAVLEKVSPITQELEKLGTWTSEFTGWVVQ